MYSLSVVGWIGGEGEVGCSVGWLVGFLGYRVEEIEEERKRGGEEERVGSGEDGAGDDWDRA